MHHRLQPNFISVSQLTDIGFEVRMLGDRCTATRSGKHDYIVIEGVKSANGQHIAHIAVRTIKSIVFTRTQKLQKASEFAITGT